MFLVVDANRVFSSLLSKGRAFDVFLLNNILNSLWLISPEYLFFEIGKHLDEILERSKLSSEELSKVFKFIKDEVDFLPFKEFNMFADAAGKLAPHSKDVQYFALALASNGAIWSDEKAFKKQSKVKVFNTDEVLALLFSGLRSI